MRFFRCRVCCLNQYTGLFKYFVCSFFCFSSELLIIDKSFSFLLLFFFFVKIILPLCSHQWCLKQKQTPSVSFVFLPKYKKLHGLPRVMRTIKILLDLPNLSFLYFSFLEKDKRIWPLRLLDVTNPSGMPKKKLYLIPPLYMLVATQSILISGMQS